MVFKVGDIVCLRNCIARDITGTITNIARTNALDATTAVMTVLWANSNKISDHPVRSLRTVKEFSRISAEVILEKKREQYHQNRPHEFETESSNGASSSTTKKINLDAVKYMDAVNNTMMFEDCGICGEEHGTSKLVPLSECQDRINLSKIKEYHLRLIAPKDDVTAVLADRNYALAADCELKDGVLRHAKYACKRCVNELPTCAKKVTKRVSNNKSNRTADASPSMEQMMSSVSINDEAAEEEDNNAEEGEEEQQDNSFETSKKRNNKKVPLPVPKYALVNGRFRGSTPSVLKCLNRTELSLVCLIDVVARVSLLPKSSHYSSSATVFSVFNDINTIAASLPQNPTPGQFSIIRSPSSSNPGDFRYSPRKIVDALQWLSENNFLYTNKVHLPSVGSNSNDQQTALDWTGGGRDVEIELPTIEATPEDYYGLDAIFSELSSEVGHSVNPGAQTNFTITDVLLIQNEDDRDVLTQVQQIVSGARTPTLVTTRARGELVADYTSDFFLQMAFVQLYPYGRGGPVNGCKDVTFDEGYITHLLNLGGNREFQQCPTFIFYAYTWKMKKKVGTVSYLAGRHTSGEGDQSGPTVEEAQQFLSFINNNNSSRSNSLPDLISETKMRMLLNKMQPYSENMPGTELFFQHEQKKLLSIISSSVTNTEGRWRFFYTEAQPDLFCSDIYDNAITSSEGLSVHAELPGSTIQLRRASADRLTRRERSDILQSHPALSARIHALQQDAFWEFVINGLDLPFGQVLDLWRRVEFQLRGTPHSHNLINVKFDGLEDDSVDSDDPVIVEQLCNLMRTVANARLLSRRLDDHSELPNDQDECSHIRAEEKMYSYNINRKLYFKNDRENPCLERFVAADRDFSVDPVSGVIEDKTVQVLYRRLQLCNQMHTCQQSCFKYNKHRANGTPMCRYDFMKPEEEYSREVCVIHRGRDNRSRVKVSVNPPRNNGNMNVCCTSPLIVLASKGNHDVQFIQNKTGGAEYASKYASKADTADSKSLQNAISRKLAKLIVDLPPHELPTYQQKLRTVGNAIISSQQIGTVHACYILLQQPLVISSRKTVNVNTLQRKDITAQNLILDPETLDSMTNNESALNNKQPSTQFGKRDAFHLLWMQQFRDYKEQPVFDFASFLCAFRVSKDVPSSRSARSKIKSGSHKLYFNQETGFIEGAKTFYLKNVLYTAVSRRYVLHLTPHIPVQEDSERACYSILLLHSPWGIGGEASILNGSETASEKLDRIGNTLPQYVKKSLRRREESETLLANIGQPEVNLTQQDNTQNDLDDFLADENGDDEAAVLCDDEYANVESISIDDLGGGQFGRGVKTNAPIGLMASLNNYIEHLKESYQTEQAATHSLTEIEKLRKELDPHCIIDVNQVDALRLELANRVAMLNAEQLRAYNTAKDHLSGGLVDQMVMFLSGEGGTGKSMVIHTITMYAHIFFGKVDNLYGCVLKTAPTGGAAHNIRGHTWQSALGKSTTKRLTSKSTLSPQAALKLQRKLKGTVLFILDELSLASSEDLFEISKRLCEAMGVSDKPFGGIHTILAGDFYQMKTMSGTPIVQPTIFNERLEAKAGRKIFTQLTHYVLLVQNCRAASIGTSLAPLAAFNTKVRKGIAEPDVLAPMNLRVVNNIPDAMRRADPNAVWITSTHKKIDAINKQFSDKLLYEDNQPIFRIIAKHIPNKVGVPVADKEKRDELYSHAGDKKGGRNAAMLTYLDLQIGTRVRLTRNLLVSCGLFNGTMGTVYGFVYKGPGPQNANQRVPSNFSVLEDSEREIPIVLVQMDGVDDPDISKCTFPYSCSKTVPRLIPISPVASMVLIQGSYIRMQLPLLPAFARTAHSLQGYTAENGIVVDVGSSFFAGDYVAISRAKDIKQIHLLGPVKSQYFTSHPEYRLLVHQEYQRLHQTNDVVE